MSEPGTGTASSSSDPVNISIVTNLNFLFISKLVFLNLVSTFFNKSLFKFKYQSAFFYVQALTDWLRTLTVGF